MFAYHCPEQGGTSPKFTDAFAKGSGLQVTNATDYQGDGWAGFGSPHTWEALRACRKNGDDWIYGDHAYFGRGEFYRVTRNAFQFTGTCERKRTDIVPPMKAWQKDGSHILVCPPDDKIAELMGFSEDYWLKDVLCRLECNSDRCIKVRRRNTETPLHMDLLNAWALVTWTSNAAVEAILAGVPVFCTGDCAASRMGRVDPINVEYPIYPDNRYEWAATLAANQWTLDEIASGIAWEVLKA